jgi:hypothetical protein
MFMNMPYFMLVFAMFLDVSIVNSTIENTKNVVKISIFLGSRLGSRAASDLSS